MNPSIAAPRHGAFWHHGILIILAAVFGYAGMVKLGNPEGFSHVVARYEVLPTVLINPVAVTLPAFELLLAVAIVVPAWRRGGLLGVLLCSVVFACLLATAIVRGLPVACGCFDLHELPSRHAAWWGLGRNLLIACISMALYQSFHKLCERHDSNSGEHE